jgi:hypothetical protein
MKEFCLTFIDTFRVIVDYDKSIMAFVVGPCIDVSLPLAKCFNKSPKSSFFLARY